MRAHGHLDAGYAISYTLMQALNSRCLELPDAFRIDTSLAMPQLPQSIELRVEQGAVDDLMARLRRTRWSPEIENSQWEYGANGAFLRDLVEYWQHGFDWRKQETEINRYAHFRLEVIEGVPIHFILERGKGPAPIPLILTHGWPWTFWDWHQLIGPLTDPARYGGDPADSFDVIVPSLPGYCLSTPLSKSRRHGADDCGPLAQTDA